jgi:hypothetical protein
VTGGVDVPLLLAAIGASTDGVDDGAATFGTVSMPTEFGMAGIRGKENRSLMGGKTGAAPGDVPFPPSTEYGVVPGAAAAPSSDIGTELRFVPAGGAVGGEAGIAEILGKENISLPGGSVGAAANGEAFPSARKSGGEPGTGGFGAVLGAPGTTAVAPANDAAIARRSVSVSGPIVVAGGDPGALAAHSGPVSRIGTPSGNVVTGMSSDSPSAAEEEWSAIPLFSPRLLGIARKNSFASLSSVAGSGNGIAPKG